MDLADVKNKGKEKVGVSISEPPTLPPLPPKKSEQDDERSREESDRRELIRQLERLIDVGQRKLEEMLKNLRWKPSSGA
ncbi:hypothetical protein COLO4_16478 [Corchorus olitorius]|uniref:Uncharacterized protein n=1 Tax=Corchorus olitorius TaxID=93759 RepID=A0A1R3JH86_9ROSI|nr:hypothetical protein COLO4_16478 [Corchorus olitorius]